MFFKVIYARVRKFLRVSDSWVARRLSGNFLQRTWFFAIGLRSRREAPLARDCTAARGVVYV